MDSRNRPTRLVDSNGVTQPSTDILGMRQFLKRLRTLFHLKGKPGFVLVHASNSELIPAYSFVTAIVDGEQFRHRLAGDDYIASVSLDQVRMQNSPGQYGVRNLWTPQFDYFHRGDPSWPAARRTTGFRNLVTLVLLHDGDSGRLRAPGRAPRPARVLDGFGTNEPLPRLLSPAPLATTTRANARVSAYRRPGALLLVVGTWRPRRKPTCSDLAGRPCRRPPRRASCRKGHRSHSRRPHRRRGAGEGLPVDRDPLKEFKTRRSLIGAPRRNSTCSSNRFCIARVERGLLGGNGIVEPAAEPGAAPRRLGDHPTRSPAGPAPWQRRARRGPDRPAGLRPDRADRQPAPAGRPPLRLERRLPADGLQPRERHRGADGAPHDRQRPAGDGAAVQPARPGDHAPSRGDGGDRARSPESSSSETRVEYRRRDGHRDATPLPRSTSTRSIRGGRPLQPGHAHD